MKTNEIAERINAHLNRFEADPIINKPSEYKLRPYYCVNASANRRGVAVTYVSFQGSSTLTKADAERYLTWLDAGNVGRHFEAQREAQP